MVQRSGSANRKTGRQETFLDASRMGCGKTQNQRKTGKDGMEELERKVARKSIQKEVSKGNLEITRRIVERFSVRALGKGRTSLQIRRKT